MPRVAKKAGSYHHGDLRRVLLDTAVRVVEKEGLAALSLHAIARRAGVSSGAPYHHFQSREELLAAIAERGFELLVNSMRSASDEAPLGAVSHLEALGRGYVRFALAHPGHFRVMFRPELRAHMDKEIAGSLAESFTMLKEGIERCQKEGLAPPGDPAPLTLLAWSAVHGASALWIDGSLEDVHLVADGEELATKISSIVATLFVAGGNRYPRPAGGK
jgi:AcrR family transcriptional regulator